MSKEIGDLVLSSDKYQKDAEEALIASRQEPFYTLAHEFSSIIGGNGIAIGFGIGYQYAKFEAELAAKKEQVTE